MTEVNPENSRTRSPSAVLIRRVAVALPYVAVVSVIVLLVARPGGEGEFAWLRLPQETIRITPSCKRVTTAASEPGLPPGTNVLLVTLDTTRAGRLGCYGNQAIHTPVLDRLASEGMIFADAVTTAPTTLPAHASILTGLYPVHHGARGNGRFRVDDTHTTLAEALQAQGYATAAVVSAFVLDSRFGLAQGFERYFDNVELDGFNQELGATQRRAETTTDNALRWLAETSGQPFFLWVHYFDPHANYDPPEPFKSRYAGNPYDGEIAYVDAQLGRIVAHLEQAGLADRTLIVVVGDHGEALGEHDEHTHGYLLYDVTLHVPWIMRCGKRLGGGASIERRVSVVDLMPTVLSLIGVDTVGIFDGRDLTQPWDDDRPMFAETYQGWMEYGWAALFSVYAGNFKYIHGPDPELYDLAADPREQRNLVADQPQTVERMLAELRGLFGSELDPNSAIAATETLDSAELRRLQALGYAAGGGETPVATGLRDDPKARIGLVNRIFEITCYYQPRGMVAEAIRLLEELAGEYPNSYAVYFNLANAYLNDGRTTEAAGAFKECLRIDAGALTAEYGLARVDLAERRRDEAIARLERIVSIQPDYVGARYDLAGALAAGGRHHEAGAHVLRAFESDPTRLDCLNLLVREFHHSGETRELIAVLQTALDQAPGLTDVRSALATQLIRDDQPEAAEALLREGIDRDPNARALRARLAWFLVNRPDKARRDPQEAGTLLQALGDCPGLTDPGALFNTARAWANLGEANQALPLAERALEFATRRDQPRLQAAIERFIRDTRLAQSQDR